MNPKFVIVFAIIAILNVSQSSYGCSDISPCTPLTGGELFRKPHEARSSNGLLNTSLRVAINTFTIDWLTSLRRLYNGTFPGPTLKVRANDQLLLKLINELEQPDFTNSPPGTFRFPNTTNIHTHGLHISSKTPQDNTLTRVEPGSSFQYDLRIDANQAPGTYWYHPHLHGSVFFQNLGGMAGMLIVEDPPSSMPAELDAASCPNHCENDIPVVMQLFQYSNHDDGSYSVVQKDNHDDPAFRLTQTIANSSTTLEEWLEEPSNNIQYMLVNGQLQPNITLRPGSINRFRLLNAGGLFAVALRISNTNSSGGSCAVKEIAFDGRYLNEARDQRLGRTFLVAAARADWLVICNEPGVYQLESVFYPVDKESLGEHPSFNGTLMTVTVAGTPPNPTHSFPTTLPPRPSYESDLRSVSDDEICGKFAVEVTPTDTLNREDFSPSKIRYKAEVDTVQEWYFTNTEYITSHPIHKHVNAFQVISYNKYTGPVGVDNGGDFWKLFSQSKETCRWQHSNYNASVAIDFPNDALEQLGHEVRQQTGGPGSIGYVEIGVWRDTLLVPALSNVTIRFKTNAYTGNVVTHCHLLGDADQGMALFTEIVEKGSNLTAQSASGGALPWSCMENREMAKCDASSVNTSNYIFTAITFSILLNSF